MGRKSTGTVRLLKGEHGERQWHAKWTRADSKRTRTPWWPIDPSIEHGPCCAVTDPECEHRRQAKVVAARMAPGIQRASAGEGTPSTIETVTDYADRWCEWREGDGLGCVDADRTLLRRHVLSTIGGLDVRTASRDDLKRLVRALDLKAKAGVTVEEDGTHRPFGWKTATNAWVVVRALFRDAQRAKAPALCVRDDNPADGVAPPDMGANKAKVYLWPSEFADLMACERVPRRWRRLFALAVYTYARAGELAALEWADVDLEHGTIHVHRSLDSKRGRGLKATKSEAARRVPIEPELWHLLQAMRDEAAARV